MEYLAGTLLSVLCSCHRFSFLFSLRFGIICKIPPRVEEMTFTIKRWHDAMKVHWALGAGAAIYLSSV